jgi:hypothetical protein
MTAERANEYPGQLAPGVAAALAAAEIPPSKLGPARRARLSEAERELYFWTLRRFATDGRPQAVHQKYGKGERPSGGRCVLYPVEADV